MRLMLAIVGTTIRHMVAFKQPPRLKGQLGSVDVSPAVNNDCPESPALDSVVHCLNGYAAKAERCLLRTDPVRSKNRFEHHAIGSLLLVASRHPLEDCLRCARVRL
jgi:hypothetical protein